MKRKRLGEVGLVWLALALLTGQRCRPDATIDDFYGRCRVRGWVPYTSVRDLSQLTANLTLLPD